MEPIISISMFIFLDTNNNWNLPKPNKVIQESLYPSGAIPEMNKFFKSSALLD